MSSLPVAEGEATPLLATARQQVRASSERSSFATSTMRRKSLREVHPNPSEVEARLPAAAIAADASTSLHNPMWAQQDDGEPNPWARFRHLWKEELAEFLGTFMILLFGAGVECQVNLHYKSTTSDRDALYGDYLQARLTWAVGVAVATWIAGGISGGHSNPTVTIALAIFRGFPYRKIPGFIISQVAGATCASLCVYANYVHSISRYEGGEHIRTVVGAHATAPLFFTMPNAGLPYGSAFFTEFLASATLVCIVLALSDKGNLPPPIGTQPFAMFLVILGIGAALGVNTGYAMNGARDTGPRIALWLVGYGSEVWTHDSCYWLWAPWLAASLGGIAGACVYDAFIYNGRDSPFNAHRQEKTDLETV